MYIYIYIRNIIIIRKSCIPVFQLIYFTCNSVIIICFWKSQNHMLLILKIVKFSVSCWLVDGHLRDWKFVHDCWTSTQAVFCVKLIFFCCGHFLTLHIKIKIARELWFVCCKRLHLHEGITLNMIHYLSRLHVYYIWGYLSCMNERVFPILILVMCVELKIIYAALV